MPRNPSASVHRRLLNLARARDEDFNRLLVTYGNERLLYRLSRSPFSGRFVLKGAALFAVWMGRALRPTKDLDFLGYGDASPDALREIFRRVCGVETEPDGLRFDAESVHVEPIREEREYGGQRIRLNAFLGPARILLTADVGFGDAVTPEASEADIPALLDFAPPRIRIYPKETMVAEKFEAMVRLGEANSRFKDFYDVWSLCRRFSFDGDLLCRAVAATFGRRDTSLEEEEPVALTRRYGSNPDQQRQWTAFLTRSGLAGSETSFAGVIQDLGGFLLPIWTCLRKKSDPPKNWSPEGFWK